MWGDKVEEKKERINDIVPEIKMTDILNGNFFRVHYPLEDSELIETEMHNKSTNTQQSF